MEFVSCFCSLFYFSLLLSLFSSSFFLFFYLFFLSGIILGHANLFFLNKVLVLVGFFFLSLFQDPCCLTYQYYSDNYQSGGAAEGHRLQQHPYFYALRSHGFRVKSTILPSQFLATIFSGRIAPMEQAVEYVVFFLKNLFLVLDWTSVSCLTVSLCGFL